MTHGHDLSRVALPAVLTASDAVATGGARFQRGPSRCMISRVLGCPEVATPDTPVLGPRVVSSYRSTSPCAPPGRIADEVEFSALAFLEICRTIIEPRPAQAAASRIDRRSPAVILRRVEAMRQPAVTATTTTFTLASEKEPVPPRIEGRSENPPRRCSKRSRAWVPAKATAGCLDGSPTSRRRPFLLVDRSRSTG